MATALTALLQLRDEGVLVQKEPRGRENSEEETCDMVAPAMKKREFNFTEATRF